MLSMRRRVQCAVDTAEQEAQDVRLSIDECFDRFLEVANTRADGMSTHLWVSLGKTFAALEAEKAECSSALADIWRTIDFVEKVCAQGTDLEVLQAKRPLQQALEKRVGLWQALARRPAPVAHED